MSITTPVVAAALLTAEGCAGCPLDVGQACLHSRTHTVRLADVVLGDGEDTRQSPYARCPNLNFTGWRVCSVGEHIFGRTRGRGLKTDRYNAAVPVCNSSCVEFPSDSFKYGAQDLHHSRQRTTSVSRSGVASSIEFCSPEYSNQFP